MQNTPETKLPSIEHEYVDISNLPLYTRTWETKNYTTVYGYKMLLPDEPADEYCVNNGLKPYDQVYRRTLIPKDLLYWKKEAMEEFISREWHRRREGIWYLINGKKYYIPGVYYFFLVYWTLQTGKKPLFRMSDLDFYLIWMHVVMSPLIYGLVVFKCRRIGDTEKAICIVYEYASRVRNTINGMQDCRKEDEIEKTYARLVYGHQKMIWFMKPINKGSSDPKANLEFKHPETKETVNKLIKKNTGKTENEVEFEFEALNSEINYYVSTPEATDGKRHGRYYCDEFGKPKKLNPIEGWRYTKKTLTDDIYEVLSGKSLYTSTIEEEVGIKAKDTSKFLDIAEEMWDMCDPELLNESGETTSGMIRIVRGALERGRPDRFGFADKKRLLEKIESDKRHLIENKQWKKLVEYSRQNCVDIDDIFTSMSGDSNFNVENLVERENRIKFEKGVNKAVRGNFQWVDGKKFGDVYWEPNPNGRFLVSGHPKDWGLKANAKTESSRLPRPKNIHAFCCGIDPVSQKDVLEKDPSKAGLCIKRKLDMNIDGLDKFDDKGNPLLGGEGFSTNRYVCTMLYRWKEPTRNYEDWLMALIYYGSDFLIEKNHSAGFMTYLELSGFNLYYMDNSKTVKNYKGETEDWGISASEKTIELYFSLLSTITNLWWNTIDHIDLTGQLKSMNYENRGRKDLGVAAGFCEIAAQRELPGPKDRTVEKSVHFDEIIV